MITINSVPVGVNCFPDGTLHISVEQTYLDRASEQIIVEWKYEPNEEMVLYYVVKHIRDTLHKACDITLCLPYIPNARMDRVVFGWEVFTLKYFCDFINDLQFANVIVRDSHSNVALALLNNVRSSTYVTNLITDLAERLLSLEGDFIVYPDEGAMKRYSDKIKFPYLFGIKKRDWNTGEIKGLSIHGDIPKRSFNALIVDDICSRGGTFLHTAKKLKELGANRIYLFVTHCENAILDGALIDSGLLEKIFTTKSIFTKHHNLIEVIGE